MIFCLSCVDSLIIPLNLECSCLYKLHGCQDRPTCRPTNQSKLFSAAYCFLTLEKRQAEKQRGFWVILQESTSQCDNSCTSLGLLHVQAVQPISLAQLHCFCITQHLCTAQYGKMRAVSKMKSIVLYCGVRLYPINEHLFLICQLPDRLQHGKTLRPKGEYNSHARQKRAREIYLEVLAKSPLELLAFPSGGISQVTYWSGSHFGGLQRNTTEPRTPSQRWTHCQ